MEPVEYLKAWLVDSRGKRYLSRHKMRREEIDRLGGVPDEGSREVRMVPTTEADFAKLQVALPAPDKP